MTLSALLRGVRLFSDLTPDPNCNDLRVGIGNPSLRHKSEAGACQSGSILCCTGRYSNGASKALGFTAFHCTILFRNQFPARRALLLVVLPSAFAILGSDWHPMPFYW